MVTSIQNLDSRFPIVNEDGTPTEYFMRLINDRGISQQEDQTGLAGKADKTTQIIAGNGLSGGGDLSDDRTLTLDAVLGDLTDVDMTTTLPEDGQAPIWSEDDQLWLPGDAGGGGGGGGNWELIDDYTAVGGETSIDFTGLPQDCEQIRFIVEPVHETSAGAVAILVRFNSDFGANYVFNRHYGGTTHSDSRTTGATSFDTIMYCSNRTDIVPYHDFYLRQYKETDRHAYFYMDAGWWDTSLVLHANGWWGSFAPVTEVNFILASGTFAARTRIQVWGEKQPSSGGGGGGGGLTEIPLTNYNFATGNITGWTPANSGTTVVAAPSVNPLGSGFVANANAGANSDLYQTIDLTPYATEIDAGNFVLEQFVWGVKDFSDNDRTIGYLNFFNGAAQRLMYTFTQHYEYPDVGVGIYTQNHQRTIVPLGARSVQVASRVRRADGTNNNSAHVGVRLFYGSLT